MTARVRFRMRRVSGVRAGLCLLTAATVLALGVRTAAAQAPSDTVRVLTLAQAISVATGGASPAVAIAQLKGDEAVARREQARSALFPSLSGSAFTLNHTFNIEALGFVLPGVPKKVGPVDQVDARLRATQTVFDYSSYRRLHASGLGVDQSRAETESAQETAAQTAAAAYVRAARARSVVVARQADLDLAHLLVGLADDQLRAGTGVRLDVTRAHTQEVAARGALQVARSQEARAAIDLARALGLDPGMALAAADTLDDALGSSEVPEDPAAAVAIALQRRPDVSVERAKLAKARAERSAISAERLPKIDVSADYGISGMHVDDAIPTRQVMLEANLPIFDGMRREGRVAEQNAVAREAEVRARDLEHQVTAEVRSALLDLASGREQEAVADERMRLAADEIAQARERFTSGVAGNIEVIDAQASLFRARDALIDARAAVANARVALARAAGTARSLH